MRSRNKTALKTATGLATVALALGSSQAWAADDPFALPKTDMRAGGNDPWGVPDRPKPESRGEVFWAGVIVNGDPQQGVAAMRGAKDALEIETGFAVSSGIVRGLPSGDFVRLSDIPGATWHFDETTYMLSIDVPVRSTGANMVSLAGRPRRAASAGSDLLALVVDYDLSTQWDTTGIAAGGLVASRLVKGNVALEASARVGTRDRDGKAGFTRLDTAVTVRMPDQTMSATFGDFVSQVPAGGRAVRMGGVRIGTDFSVRPDLVTQPLPDFVDSVAVPTGLDVIVNDRRVGGAEIRPGEFTVRDIPVPVGRSEIGVVVRDAVGRETIKSVDFYSSRDLLSPDLREAALNFGYVRRRYGAESDDYGTLAISSMLRAGITSRMTGTVMAEAGRSVASGGISADFVVGNLGILSVVTRGSTSSLWSKSRLGHLVELGFESVGPSLNWSLQYRKVSRYYADVATANGDAPPPSLIAANIGFDMRRHGQVRFAAIRQVRRTAFDPDGPARTIKLLSANYRRSVSNRIDLSLDAQYRRDTLGGNGLTALVGLSMQLGGSRFAQVGYTRAPGQNYLQGGYYDPERGPGDTGFGVSAGTGSINRLAVSVSRAENWSRMEAQAELVGDALAARVGMRGSLVVADGQVFAADGASDTYILVDAAGIGGLEVERENRLAGTTGSQGRLLIGQVPGYNDIKIGVDPARLPIDITAASIEEIVTAAPRSVARVRLDLARYVPHLLTIVDPGGRTFAAGTTVRALPSGKEYYVGMDGQTELNAAAHDDALEIDAPDGSTCRADLQDVLKTLAGNEVLRCTSRMRTYALGTAPPPATSRRP